jgi:hypothetical protein
VTVVGIDESVFSVTIVGAIASDFSEEDVILS